MSYAWTPEFTASVLRGVTDARLAEITFHAFQMYPCAQFLPSAIGIRLIAEERARRAQARRVPPAEPHRPAATAQRPSQPTTVASSPPIQIDLFE